MALASCIPSAAAASRPAPSASHWGRCRPAGIPRLNPGRPRSLQVSLATAAPSQSTVSAPFDSLSRGFLPPADPLRRLRLPGTEAWEEALDEVPKLVVAGGNGLLRRTLEQLPSFPLELLLPAQGAAAAGADGQQLWRAYMLISFLSHAYMWCELGPGGQAPAPQALPARLAVPWVAVANAVGMPPVLVYATYNLLNWRRLDPAGPVALGNIVCLHNFMASTDEEWFRLVHVAIEAQAAEAVARLSGMQAAAAQGDTDEVREGLGAMADTLRAMQATLGRMGEKCDPYVYYQRVRQPMSGWRGNPQLPQGLLYEGVHDQALSRWGPCSLEGTPGSGQGWGTRLQLFGETGAQSSIVPAFDAVLGVNHDREAWLQGYLRDMRLHMPPPHRAFLSQLEQAGVGGDGSHCLRAMCAAAPAGSAGGLKEAYNDAVTELEKFRSQHKAFAFNYIAKFAKAEAQQKGTGGSDFMPALQGYRDTTSRHVLG